MPQVPFSWTRLGLSNAIFLCLFLYLALISSDHITFTDALGSLIC